MADITKPPQNPIRFMSSAIRPASHGEYGVICHKAAPRQVGNQTERSHQDLLFRLRGSLTSRDERQDHL